VVAEQVDICPPCGGCRQRLAEFARPDTPVYLGRPAAAEGRPEGKRRTLTLAELLPLSFSLDP
jgi:cytidine deaminase